MKCLYEALSKMSAGAAILLLGMTLFAGSSDYTWATEQQTCNSSNGECSVYKVKDDCQLAGACGDASLNCVCKWGTSCTCETK